MICMVCKCRDGTYGPQCCSRGRGKSSRRRSTPARSPSPSTLGQMGSAVTGRRVSHWGQQVINLGIAEIGAAQFSQPPSSGKVWMAMTKKEARIHRPDIRKADKKKYDWQPKGNTLRGSFRDSRIGTRGKRVNFRHGEWEEHWKRRPVKGPYSQPTEAEVRSYRKSQSRKGLAKVGIGGGLRLLGEGFMIVQLGIYASWLHDDPSLNTLGKIGQDLLGVPMFEPLAAAAANDKRLNWNNVMPGFGSIV